MSVVLSSTKCSSRLLRSTLLREAYSTETVSTFQHHFFSMNPPPIIEAPLRGCFVPEMRVSQCFLTSDNLGKAPKDHTVVLRF